MKRQIGILIGTLAASTALAATHTVTVTGSGQGYAALPTFDTSLGALRSATIQANYNSTVGFVAYGGIPASYDHAISGVFALGNLVFALNGATLTTPGYGPFGTFAVTGSGSASYSTAADLATLLGGAYMLSASAYSPPPGLVLSGASAPALSYNLTYAYDDGRPSTGSVNANVGAVPEPASWAMMIGGFGLVGAALRAGRRRAVPARG